MAISQGHASCFGAIDFDPRNLGRSTCSVYVGRGSELRGFAYKECCEYKSIFSEYMTVSISNRSSSLTPSTIPRSPSIPPIASS